MAREEAYSDQYTPLAQAEALARVRVKHHRRGEKLFLEVAALQISRGNYVGAAIARHDAGVCAMRGGRGEAARGFLMDACSEARRGGNPWWAARCALDAARLTGDLRQRCRILRSATKLATASNDASVRLEVAREAAAACYEAEDYTAADRELVRAIGIATDPDVRSSLAVDRFYVAVDAEWPRRAEARFDEARSVAAATGEPSYLVDLNAAAGDWLWDRGGAGRTSAAEAYTAAMLEALRIGVETAIEVGVHFASRLLGCASAELRSLREATETWMKAQDVGLQLVRFSGWPMDVAETIGPIVRTGRSPSAKTVSRAVTTALKAAVAVRIAPVTQRPRRVHSRR
jgi:hypothetical protein